jgi:hypothetical protein
MASKMVCGVALALASLLLAKIGSAEEASSLRKGTWPIHNGHNFQPTERELRGLHREDVTPNHGNDMNTYADDLAAIEGA